MDLTDRAIRQFQKRLASVIAANGGLDILNDVLINVLDTSVCYRNFQYVCGVHVVLCNEWKWSAFYAPPFIFS